MADVCMCDVLESDYVAGNKGGTIIHSTTKIAILLQATSKSQEAIIF